MFQVKLVGDVNVGKSSWIRRLMFGDFIPTKFCSGDVYLYRFEQTDFLIYDTDKYTNTPEFDAFVFFYENNLSPQLINQMNKCDLPYILCRTKCDINNMNLTELRNHHRFLIESIHTFKPYSNNKNMRYYDISAKTCYNFDKPFVGLIQLLETKSV